jgi:hypothetical protein
MLSKEEENREVQQWGLLLNIARNRKSLSEMPHSNASRIIENMIERLEVTVKEIRGDG